MMENKEIFERLKALVVKELKVGERLVVPEANLCEDLGVESVDFINFIADIEQEFGISFSLNELERVYNLFGTVENTCRIIAEKQ